MSAISGDVRGLGRETSTHQSCHQRWRKSSPNSQLRPSSFQWIFIVPTAQRKHTHYSEFIIYNHNPMLSFLGKHASKMIKIKKKKIFPIQPTDKWLGRIQQRAWGDWSCPSFTLSRWKSHRKCNPHPHPHPRLLPFRKRLFSWQFYQMIYYEPQHNNSLLVNLEKGWMDTTERNNSKNCYF